MRMPGSEYNSAKRYIEDRFRYGNGSVEEYVAYLRNIINKYDDGYECAKSLDSANSKWTVFGKYL